MLSDYREEVIAALDMDLTEIFYLGGQFIVGLRHYLSNEQFLINDKLNMPLILILVSGTCTCIPVL